MLEIISKNHNFWLAIVKGYGETTYAEDIVQEFYLKIYLKSEKDKSLLSKLITDEMPNIGYIIFILKNMTLDLHRQKSRINKVGLDEIGELEDYYEGDSFGYSLFLQRLDTEMNTWHSYDRKLFMIRLGTYGSMNLDTFGKKQTIRKIAKDIGLGTSSVFNTITNCEDRLRDSLGETWEDFKNGDYEWI